MAGPDSPDWGAPAVLTAQPMAREVMAVGESPATGILIPAVAGRVIVVQQVQLSAFGSSGTQLRAMILGNIGWDGEPPGEIIARVVISPEHPSDRPLISPQAAQVPAGQDVTYSVVSSEGAGVQSAELSAIYYLV